MPTYLVLMRLTEHGVRNIQNAPARIEEAIRAFEAVGGRVTSFYAVMGEYDFVSIVEGPSDEIVLTFSLGLSAAGNVRTTSLKALSKEQFDRAIRQLDRLDTLAKLNDLPDLENVETER
jgi:uncharacterized protein with GYD domain